MKRILIRILAVGLLASFFAGLNPATTMAQEEVEKKGKNVKEEEIVVIVNEKSPLFLLLKKGKKKALLEKDLKNIYLGKVKFWGKTKILLVNQKDKKIFKAFLKKFIGITYTSYKNYWVKKVFTEGGSAPKIKAKSEDVVEYVSENKGGIGYLWKDDLTGEEEGIKIVPIKKKKRRLNKIDE